MLRKLPRLAAFFVRDRSIAGDLLEEYATGEHSRWWLWRQVFSTMRPDVRLPRQSHLFFAFSKDVHYAARTLAKNPVFTSVAVLAIALGIGVNAGIFSILNAAALRPLPLPGALRLASVYQIFQGKVNRNVHGNDSMFSVSEYQTYRDSNHVFSGIMAYAPMVQITLGGAKPRQVVAQYTSCNYFDVVAQPPMIGRAFALDCAAPGASAVIVLSDHFWRNEFGADPAIVGRKIVLNRHKSARQVP